MKNTYKSESNSMQWIAAFAVLLSILLWWSESTLSAMSLAHWPNLFTLIETTSAVIYALIALIAGYVSRQNRDQSARLIFIAFLCAATFMVLHALTDNSTQHFRVQHFLLLSQSIVGITLLFIAIRSNGKFIRLLCFGLTSALVATLLNSLYAEQGITFANEEFGRSTRNHISDIILIMINLAAAATLYAKNTSNSVKLMPVRLEIKRIHLFFACLLMAVATILLAPGNIRNVYTLVGQILQLLAAIALLQGMVSANFLMPFAALADRYHQLQTSEQEQAIHKQRLTGIIETAIDGIITIDEKQKIVMANPAAAAIFAYSVDALLGAHLDSIIPLRHRKSHGNHINQFGQTGVSKRKMGSNFEDFYITGLRSDGTELPIEASISSSIENGLRFFTVIFRDITDSKAAKEKMALYHTQLSQLSTALQSIREEERKHIARELHDDLGQLLAALRMDLSLLHRDTQMTEKSGKILTSMDQLILTSITTLRRIATDLRPRALDEGGLFFALKTLQKDFSSRHGIDCELIANEELLILDDAHSTAIFRIIQESLTNVVRHAGASEVQIEFQREASSLRFTIRDNGRGIEQEDMKKSRSFGLVGMRERIKAMQGELTITSTVGEGTSLEIHIPLQIDQVSA